MNTEIKPNSRLVKMAYYISQLQDEIASFIDTNKKDDPRIDSFAKRLTDIEGYISDLKGEIGEQIGGMIIDSIDRAGNINTLTGEIDNR